MLKKLYKETKILAEIGYADEPGQVKYLTASFSQHPADCGEMAEFCPVFLLANNIMMSSVLSKQAFLMKNKIETRGREGNQDSFVFNASQIGSSKHKTDERKAEQAKIFLMQFSRACNACRNRNR